MLGKIIKGIAGFYYVQAEDGNTYACRAKGIFRSQNIKPLVGDRVEIQILDETAKEGSVTRILARTNMLIRPAVANIDQALVVFAVQDPEPNCNLLDRFLISMEYQHIPVHICFNKMDLTCSDLPQQLRNTYEKAGYRVFFLSTRTGDGIDAIRGLLHKKTTVLAGPSGVGKSSLINLLYPQAEMETGAVSEKIRRGKHTTRHSEFFCLEPGTYLFDTPGFSSVYLPDCPPEQLKDFYPEFRPYEEQCRFLGCVHMGERDCGVKDAVRRGDIAAGRYENYRLFYGEQKEKRRYP